MRFPDALVADGAIYQWRARAEDDDGAVSEWSAPCLATDECVPVILATLL